VVPAGESGGGLQPAWSADSLEPYGQIIAAGNADIVMIGHGSHPDFSGEPGLPASLSTHAIQDILRARLGFTGVVISGDLEQLAAGQDASPQDIAVRAAAAGNDIVFFSNRQRPDPGLPDKIAAAFREAVADGRLSREKLEASRERIKALKQRLGGSGKAIASAQPEPHGN
jgi:beta-N-acetylhexosaminidase